MADIFNVDRTNNTITLGTTGTVTTLPFLTANKLLALNGSKNIVSTDLNSWVAGTANEITVTDEGDGTITLSTPQAIGTGSSPTFVDLTLTGKLVAGTWGSPIDVTNTRKYGFELHYSGNNYDVFGIRSRANLITTANSSTKTATGAELQAANSNGISVNVLCGAKCSSTGKSTANSATISYMRGVDIITEWGAKDTVTNLYNTHLKCITRTSAGEGSFGTGYGIYLENIAVGGTGQTLDAGIRFQETDLAGVEGFTYGIDFRGGTYATAELVCSSGTLINGSIITAASTDTTDPKFCLKTTNTAHEVCFQLDESTADDHVDFKGQTGGVNTRFHVVGQTDKSVYMGLQQGSYRGELILGTVGHLTLQNTAEDCDILLKIDDGGVTKTITWDASEDKLIHSAGTFNFDSGNLTTTGTLGCAALTGTSTAIFEGASVAIGKASTTTGTIVLYDSESANTITLTVPDITAGSLTFTLPPTDGANTNVLQTDGNGVLTWVAATAADSEKVKVDVGATADYIGAANSDGVLRTTTGLSYADGGNFVTLGLSHLGLEALSDPGADRLLFWDNSESAFKWNSPSTGLVIATTSLGLNLGALTEETAPDVLDVVVIYDPTGGAHHKVQLSNLKAFSAYTDEDSNTDAMVASHAYKAATDGFVHAYVADDVDTGEYVQGFVGATDDPHGAGVLIENYIQGTNTNNATIPIRFEVAKDEYFEIRTSSAGSVIILWKSVGTLSKPVDQD